MVTRVGTALDGDVSVNGIRYPLAILPPPDNPRGFPGPAWWRALSVVDQEAPPEDFGPGRPITAAAPAQWIPNRQKGHGRAKSSKTRGLGVHASIGWDDSLDNFLRLTPTKFTLTPSNATTDVATYFFEEDISSTLNYYCQQRYTYRMTVNSGTGAITSVNETDHGASAVAGRMAKFKGKWYIALGSAVAFKELTTPSSNTFTTQTDSLKALAFATIMDALTPKMARAHTTNQVSLVGDDPMTAADWSGGSGSGFSVGDTTGTITCIAESGIILFVGKTNNLFAFTPTSGATQPVLNPGSGKGQSINGLGLVAIPSTEIAAYNHDGLHIVDGTTMLMGRGPDGVGSMQAIPNFSLEPHKMTHYESAICGNWFYTIGRVSASGSTRSFIYGTDIRTVFGAPSEMEWHLVAVEDSWIRGLEVASDKKLWFATNGVIKYLQLGADGSPDAGPNSKGYGNISSTYRIFLEATDYGLAATPKQVREVRVVTRNLSATASLQVESYMDGGSAVNVGAAITTNGVTSRFFTQGTGDQGVNHQLALLLTTNGSYTVTDDPQVWLVEADPYPLSDKTGVVEFVVDTGAPYKNGIFPDQDAKTRRDALVALEGAASVACVDPDGNTIYLHIDSVRDKETRQYMNGVSYLMTVVARERRTS